MSAVPSYGGLRRRRMWRRWRRLRAWLDRLEREALREWNRDRRL